MSTTAAFLDARPRLRPDTVLGAAQQRGPARVHLVRVLDTERSLEVGGKEHFVLVRLDGTRSLAEIGADYEREFGKALTEASWAQILGTLHRRGLLAAEGRAADQGPYVRGPARPADHGLGKAIPVVRAPSAFLDKTLRWTRALFNPGVAVPVLAAVVVMELLLLGRTRELLDQALPALHRPGPLLLVAAFTWVTTALHELAHGVAARRYGVPVLEIGIRWLPPLVLPYCRTDGYLYLPRRRSHVVIAGAGIFVELALLLPLYSAWRWGSFSLETRESLAALLLSGSVHALLNLLPVPPLDGYKMLGHALGLSDYARHTFAYAMLAARRDGLVRSYPAWVRAFYSGYALTALLVLTGLLGSLFLAADALLDSRTWAAVSVAALVGLSLGGGYQAMRRGTAGPARRRHAATARPAVSARPAPAPAVPAPPAPSGNVPVDRREPGVRYRPKHARPRPALELDGVVKSYGSRRAVDGVTLTVNSGEFIGLLGPNGAGKTTLVEVAVGLRRPEHGLVSVLGNAPWPRSAEMLSRIGVQTQSAAFFVRLTAREHLRTVAALYARGPEAAEDALRVVGLEDSADIRAERLSGGQQQRLAIATALVHDPELIFLDEPTASLDPQARRELWSVLRNLHANGRTVVYTTHHLDEAEALCDRVAIMANGSVVALGAPHELIEAAALPTRLLVPRTLLTVEAGRAVAGGTAARQQGPAVVIEADDTGPVLAELEPIVGRYAVQTRPPTLEDVYLHCTGSEQLP